MYSDKGSEYNGVTNHAFTVTCFKNGINQKFIQSVCSQTNGKAERLMCFNGNVAQ